MTLSSCRHPLFQRQSEVVRDSALVMVKREVQADGLVWYHKRFKSVGFDIWAHRENRFFNLFAFKNLPHVVKPRKTEYSEQGMTEVATLDAGLTIEEWQQVGVLLADGSRLLNPWLSGDNLLRLTHACLQALREIHAIGVIHCDIKPDNICLPYHPRSQVFDPEQSLRIDFSQLQLIDFSFSLSADIPLQEAVLPINSRSTSAAYIAPAFAQALQEDQCLGRPQQVNALDYRIDLYSLGYMLDNLLQERAIVWQQPAARAYLQQLATRLQQLPEQVLLPHDDWLQQLDAWLLTTDDDPDFTLDVSAAVSTSSTVTPITPLLETPLLTALPQEPPPSENPSPVASSTGVSGSRPKRLPWMLSLLVLAGAGGWWLSTPTGSEMVPMIQPDVPEVLANLSEMSAQQVVVLQQQAAAALGQEVKGRPCEQCPEEVVIPAGSMNLLDAQGQIEQSLSFKQPFAVATHEVTRGEFSAFVEASGYDMEGGCYRRISGNMMQEGSWRNLGFRQSDQHPVVCVNWQDALAYAQWLSQQTGYHYRLLSDAEWEYVCHAGQTSRYCGGNDSAAVGWHSGNSQKTTQPVGNKAPSVFGVYDLNGNAWEWVSGSLGDDMPAAGQQVVRGGSWRHAAAAMRSFNNVDQRQNHTGFRLARDLQSKE